MKASLAEASWSDISALRDELINTPKSGSVEGAATRFTKLFSAHFESVVLARLFVVMPMEQLDAAARDFIARKFGGEGRLKPSTPVLALLGTSGREEEWNDRLRSSGHLAIPLVDRAFVQGIPMIARLLADLEANLSNLDSGLPIASRRLLGGQNATFFVPDAREMVDAEGRAIISASPFVTRYSVRGVFGMGGAYMDGSLAVALVFTDEVLDRVNVDRFPSLISNFKALTSELRHGGKTFAEAA